MSLTGPSFEESLWLPTAYGGCRCECHRDSNLKHVMPCCYPSDDELESDQSETEKLLNTMRKIKMSDNKVTFETIRVPEGMKFNSLESETVRTYVFPDKDVVVEEPIALNVSRSGGHRVITASGKVHYVPSGWVDLVWEVKANAPHVDF